VSSNGISVKKGVINHLPTVAITAPSDESNLTGLVQVNGTADDLDFLDLLTVQLRVDSSEWADVQGNRTWFFSFDTTLYSNGHHTLMARANDQTVYSSIASINVTVENKRDIEITSTAPPPDPRIYENESQVFSVNARDPFGHELRYQWVVDGNPQPGSVTRTFTYYASFTCAGNHTVHVSVLYGTKEAGWNWTLTVLNLNRPPVAVISAPAGGTGFTISRTVPFDSAGSSDLDTDDVLNFTWDFGDGSFGYGPQATHIYTRPGKPTVTLLLSDGHNSTTASIKLAINEGARVQKDFFTQAFSEPWCPIAIALGIICVMALAVVALRSRQLKLAKRASEEAQARRREAARREEARKEAELKKVEGKESPLAKIEEEAREAVRRQAEEEAAIPDAEAAPVAAGSEAPSGRERPKGRGAPASRKAPAGDEALVPSLPEAVALSVDESSKQALPFGHAGTKAPASKKSTAPASSKEDGKEPAPTQKKAAGPQAPGKAPEAKPSDVPKPEDLSALLSKLSSDKPLGAFGTKKEAPKKEEPEKKAPDDEAPKKEEPRKEPEKPKAPPVGEPEKPRDAPRTEAPKEPERPREAQKEGPKPSEKKPSGNELTDEALADLMKRLKS
jgi:PKD repeat protein